MPKLRLKKILFENKEDRYSLDHMVCDALVYCTLMCLVAKNSLFPTLMGQQFPRAAL